MVSRDTLPKRARAESQRERREELRLTVLAHMPISLDEWIAEVLTADAEPIDLRLNGSVAEKRAAIRFHPVRAARTFAMLATMPDERNPEMKRLARTVLAELREQLATHSLVFSRRASASARRVARSRG
jgi:hypothetical protein